jgi:isopenicillin N synthase-like dioxygenase
VGKSLYTACRDVGFAYIINTSIPQEDIAGMFKWSAKFFNLPKETKEKAPHPPEGWRHRGYSSVGKEQVSYSMPVIGKAIPTAARTDAMCATGLPNGL